MGGTKGYRSYRGRTSKGKIALAVVLVLIILAAVGFLWLQEYIVYDADGNARLDLPWRQEASVPPAEEEDPLQNVEITVQEPEAPAELAAFSAGAAPLTRADWDTPATRAMLDFCRRERIFVPYYLPFRLGSPAFVRRFYDWDIRRAAWFYRFRLLFKLLLPGWKEPSAFKE